MSSVSPLRSMNAQLLLAGGLRTADDLSRVLDVLERDAMLAPRRWGPTISVRDPYDRAAITEYVANLRAEPWMVVLRRAKPVELSIQVIGDTVASITVTASGEIGVHAESLFAAVDRLASALPLEFGCIDARFHEQSPITFTRRSGGVHVGAYVDWGIPTVFPRTYFGPRLLELLGGVGVLEHSGGASHDVGGGTVALDLLPEPWTAEPAALKRAQVKIEKALRLTGIVARQAGEWRTIAGPRWVPPTIPANASPASGRPPR